MLHTRKGAYLRLHNLKDTRHAVIVILLIHNQEMLHIHVNWRGNSPTARGNSPWGVASITHIVCDRPRRRRAVLDCYWHRWLSRGPRSSRRNLYRARCEQQRRQWLFGRRLRLRQGTPRARMARPRAPFGSLGRYDYWGTLFGGRLRSFHHLRRRGEQWGDVA